METLLPWKERFLCPTSSPHCPCEKVKQALFLLTPVFCPKGKIMLTLFLTLSHVKLPFPHRKGALYLFLTLSQSHAMTNATLRHEYSRGLNRSFCVIFKHEKLPFPHIGRVPSTYQKALSKPKGSWKLMQ